MRHLIVPSVDTQHWLNELKSRGWLESGLGILTQEDGMKAIPLNEIRAKFNRCILAKLTPC